MTVNGVRKKAHHMRFNMIFNERVAVVHHFSPHYFAGATLAMNNSVFDDAVVVVNQNKWRLLAYNAYHPAKECTGVMSIKKTRSQT